VFSLFYPLSVVILWGTLFILIKDTRTPPIWGIGIGLWGGVIFLSLPAFLFTASTSFRITEPKTLLMLVAIGLLRYILGTWFFYKSIKIGDVSVATPIIGSKVLIVSILSAILRIETVDILLLVAILFASAGFFSITLHIKEFEKLHKRKLIKCIVLALAAALCWSGGDIFVMKIRHIHPLMITFGSLCFSLLLYYACIFSLKKTRMILDMSGFDKKRYFLYGAFSFAVAYLLLNLSLVKLGIIKTNVIIVLWPLVASLVGYKRYKERLCFSKICGTIMLIISFILATLR